MGGKRTLRSLNYPAAMFPFLLTLLLAFACGAFAWIGFERAGRFFDLRNLASVAVWTLGVLFLMALSMLVVTSISSALGTYGPQTRQQVLGAYFVGIFIADIVYRRREPSKRQ